MAKIYYVYRITNIVIDKHYYGFRGTFKKPKEDIGIKYFSSSSDREFIKDQKERRENYSYKIILSTPNKKKAQNLEVRLHKYFMVGTNDKFYNRATQTHIALIGTKETAARGAITRKNTALKCGTTLAEMGSIKAAHTMRDTVLSSGLSIREEASIKMVKTKQETVLENGLTIYQDSARKAVNTRKTTYLENGLTIEQDSVKRAFETGKANDSYRRSANKIYAERDEQYRLDKSANSAITMIKNGTYVSTGSKHSLYQNEIMASGLTRAQETGLKTSETRKKRFREGKITRPAGSANPAAAIINIFDADDNLMFSCNGNFQKVCEENNLPFSAFRNSYSNNGKRYTMCGRRSIKSFRHEFENWYAIRK